MIPRCSRYETVSAYGQDLWVGADPSRAESRQAGRRTIMGAAMDFAFLVRMREGPDYGPESTGD